MTEALLACREHFLTAAILSALVNILYLAPSIYMMQVYDRVVPTGGVVTLLWITAVLAFALATLSALDALRSRLLARSALRLEKKLAGQIMERLMMRPQSASNDVRTAQAMRDFDMFRGALSGSPAMVLFDIPWTPIYILVAALIHPLLALLIIVGGAILVSITVLNERSTRQQLADGQVAMNATYADQDRIAMRRDVVAALGMRRALINRLVTGRLQAMALTTPAQMKGTSFTSLAKFFRLFLQSLALGVAAWLAVEQQISVGAIIAGSILLSRGLQPVEQLVASLPAIGQARGALKTLTALFENDGAATEDRTALPAPTGEINVQGLYVRLMAGAEQRMLLNNVSFAVPAGQVLGIIGSSGAGKSTLARVLAGAMVADAGFVRFDGASSKDWDPELLARHIGYVPQDYALLSGTVAQNISRFAEWAGMARADIDAAVVAAAREAGAHDMILKLPKGYDTMIGADGSGLSAGQRQRVSLARALFGAPPILILDEPDSALDGEGEKCLQDAILHARRRGNTIIVISHRGRVMGLADKLLVMSNGTVAMHDDRAVVMAALQPQAPNAGANAGPNAAANAGNVVGLKGGN